MGEIHGGSMLHVLPAGTYGLRPAVNRSNTRTWRATLRTGDCARCCWLTLSLVPLSSPIFLLSTADYLRKYVLLDFKLLHACSDEPRTNITKHSNTEFFESFTLRHRTI